jgi:hypothetical protein
MKIIDTIEDKIKKIPAGPAGQIFAYTDFDIQVEKKILLSRH